MDMARFLLAFCCDGGDSPDTLHDARVLTERFDDCRDKVVLVANSEEMKKRLRK